MAAESRRRAIECLTTDARPASPIIASLGDEPAFELGLEPRFKHALNAFGLGSYEVQQRRQRVVVNSFPHQNLGEDDLVFVGESQHAEWDGVVLV